MRDTAQTPRLIIREPKITPRPPVRVLPGGLLTQHDAASYLDVNRDTLRRWAAAGIGPPFFRIGRVCLYLLEDLDAHLAARETAA